MESWLAFAKTSDPNNGFVPEWPTYSLEKRAFMRFDASSTTGFGPLTDKVIALLNG